MWRAVLDHAIRPSSPLLADSSMDAKLVSVAAEVLENDATLDVD